MDYDRYDAFLHHIFKQTQGDAWFRPNEDNIAVGVALRVDSGEYRLFPYENLGLEPFEAAERTLPLVHDKHGEEGSIQVRLMFQPEIIVKSRKNTSTFSTAGRAMTQFGGLPVQAGKGVFHGVTGVFKGKGSKDDDSFEGENMQAAAVPQDLPAGQTSQAINPGSVNGGSMNGSTTFPGSVESMPTNTGMGTLRVHVIDAKDLSGQDYKPYAVIRVGDKEVKTKHVGKTANPEW